MCARPADGIPGSQTARGFFGATVESCRACPRGSPFHLPTELAAGLDLGSDPQERLPAPVSPVLPPAREGFGSPVPRSRKESELRRLIASLFYMVLPSVGRARMQYVTV
jgi:hypothetical protein